MAKKPKIPVFTAGTTSTGATVSAPASAPAPSTSSSGSGGSSSSGSGGSSSSGSGGDPYGYRKKAGQQYLRQAANLQVQADALIRALKKDFRKGVKLRIANDRQDLEDGDDLLMEGYRDRLGTLKGSARDNTMAAEGQSNAARSNMLRERNSALTEAMSMGAGESDVLAAQQMSLRNWNANQSEVNRSLFDTVRSINGGLTDLNVDTKGARVGLYNQFNADRELIWTNYFNQRSEALTQLGNVYGQQADLYSSAQEYGAGGGKKGKARTKDAADAFMDAAKTTGKVWENPGVSDRILDWEGRDDFKASNNFSRLNSVQSVNLSKKPEGATLRKWDA